FPDRHVVLIAQLEELITGAEIIGDSVVIILCSRHTRWNFVGGLQLCIKLCTRENKAAAHGEVLHIGSDFFTIFIPGAKYQTVHELSSRLLLHRNEILHSASRAFDCVFRRDKTVGKRLSVNRYGKWRPSG